jgi:predicted DNA repair protein MutK
MAVMAKLVTKKTTGVSGGDLVLHAEQVLGLWAERELPVAWCWLWSS